MGEGAFAVASDLTSVAVVVGLLVFEEGIEVLFAAIGTALAAGGVIFGVLVVDSGLYSEDSVLSGWEVGCFNGDVEVPCVGPIKLAMEGEARALGCGLDTSGGEPCG